MLNQQKSWRILNNFGFDLCLSRRHLMAAYLCNKFPLLTCSPQIPLQTQAPQLTGVVVHFEGGVAIAHPPGSYWYHHCVCRMDLVCSANIPQALFLWAPWRDPYLSIKRKKGSVSHRNMQYPCVSSPCPTTCRCKGWGGCSAGITQ